MVKLRRRPGITEPLIEHFADAHESTELERLADDLGETGDPAAIQPLLGRLSDSKVQDDADVEDAVCGALVKLGVMEKLGNLNYRVSDASELPETVSVWIAEHRAWIPGKYFP